MTTQPTIQQQLLPCPFCGGEAHFDYDDNGWNWIECCQCQCSTTARVSAMDDCKPLLAESWNRRASAAAVSDEAIDAAILSATNAALDCVEYDGEDAVKYNALHAAYDLRVSELKRLIAAAPKVAVPDGFVLVPVEPTPEMLAAAMWEDGIETAKTVWREMIAAAPSTSGDAP